MQRRVFRPTTAPRRTVATTRGQLQVMAATHRANQIRQMRTFVPRQMPPASFVSQGAEIKAIDIAQATYLFRGTGVASNIILLNGVQTGAGFFNRVGSRVEMKNLHIRGPIQSAATAVQGSLRLLIIYDRQPTGTLPVISDILQSRDQAGTASTAGTSEINLDNRDRFSVVRDLTWFSPSVTYTGGVLTNGPAYSGNDDNQYDLNCFIKLKGLTTHFKSSTNPTTIADIATGALYACFVGVGTDSAWNANVSFRLRYKDQ